MTLNKAKIHSMVGCAAALIAISFSSPANAKFYYVGMKTGWDCNSYFSNASTNVKIFDNSGPKWCVQYGGDLQGGGYYGSYGGEFSQEVRAWAADWLATRGDDILVDQRNVIPMWKTIRVWAQGNYQGSSKIGYFTTVLKDVGFTIRSFSVTFDVKSVTV